VNTHLFALIGAFAVYGLWKCRAQIWDMIHNPSPTAGRKWGSWVKSLFSKGSDPDDPDDPDDEARPYRLVDDPDDPAHTRVEWTNRRHPSRADDRKADIEEHIAGLINRGWRTSEIIADAMTEFRISESTAKRALRRARDEAA
jgi:hypothetical protein